MANTTHQAARTLTTQASDVEWRVQFPVASGMSTFCCKLLELQFASTGSTPATYTLRHQVTVEVNDPEVRSNDKYCCHSILRKKPRVQRSWVFQEVTTGSSLPSPGVRILRLCYAGRIVTDERP